MCSKCVEICLQKYVIQWSVKKIIYIFLLKINWPKVKISKICIAGFAKWRYKDTGQQEFHNDCNDKNICYIYILTC